MYVSNAASRKRIKQSATNDPEVTFFFVPLCGASSNDLILLSGWKKKLMPGPMNPRGRLFLTTIASYWMTRALRLPKNYCDTYTATTLTIWTLCRISYYRSPRDFARKDSKNSAREIELRR